MKLSVALCTYNGEKFVQKQIDSILNQIIPVHEIVVCDDCSTDRTKEILLEYKEKYPTIFELHFNKENLRSNNNFEKAISLTTGDYIFLSDQDDLWVPEKVSKILAVFDENPTAEGVFSDAAFIDDNDNIIYSEISLWESVCFFHETIKQPSDLRKSLLYITNFLTGATLCIKKESKDFSIPFMTIKNFIHDEWYAFLLSHRDTLRFSTEKLIYYRLHNNQQLGVQKISNPEKTQEKNRERNNLMMGLLKPRSFKEFKTIIRYLFFQYEKYYHLYSKYNIPIFKEISDNLKNKFKESNLEMKKRYPILYLFRKLKDNLKGKRQLKN
jgi:glycosyltransferase involved in cell wall biosynthesis